MKYQIKAFLFFEDFWASGINDTVSNAISDYDNLSDAIEAFCHFVIDGYTIDCSGLDTWLQTDYLDNLEESLGDVNCNGGIVLIPNDGDEDHYLFKHSCEYDFVSKRMLPENEVEINTECDLSADELDSVSEYYEILEPIIDERSSSSFTVDYDEDNGFSFEVCYEGFIYEGYELGFYE